MIAYTKNFKNITVSKTILIAFFSNNWNESFKQSESDILNVNNDVTIR